MSDEVSKSTNEINALKEKLDMVEGQNTELKEQNTEMKEQIAKLMEEIETMKLEKLQINHNDPAQSIGLNPSSSQQMKRKLEEKSTDSADEKMDEKKAKMSERSVPNWLIEVLEWIKRVEMADSKLSTSSWTFKQLCWPKLHGNVNSHKVDFLQFRGERDESAGIYQAKLTQNGNDNIPIACVPPSEYITGFNRIEIDFLDGQVIQFIECIQPKLNGISLCIGNNIVSIFDSMEHFGQIRRLCEMLLKNATSIRDYYGVDNTFAI